MIENLIIYKKGFNTFCRKVDGSRDIERNAFFKMAATLIPIRPRQSRFRLVLSINEAMFVTLL